MRWLAGVLVLVAAAGTTDWSETPPLSGTVDAGELFIESQSGGVFPLIVIVDPEVNAPGYVIEGTVRFEAVAGAGYLEMWNVFPDGSRYFSRTLDLAGPMAVLMGTAGPRQFQLPFDLAGTTALPNRLEINLVLPGAGRVWIGPLSLRAMGDQEISGQTFGITGALAGVAGGLVGVAGVLVGWLASRGRARRFVLGSMKTLAVGGLLSLIYGGARLMSGVRFLEVYPFLLLGVITAGVFGGLVPSVHRRYAEAELRRVQAMDLVR